VRGAGFDGLLVPLDDVALRLKLAEAALAAGQDGRGAQEAKKALRAMDAADPAGRGLGGLRARAAELVQQSGVA